MKKVLLLVLAIAMLFSLWTFAAFADEADEPALLISASQLGSAGNQYLNGVGHELLEEDGASFVRFTATAGDPWVWIQPVPTTDAANKYAAVKYRTSVSTSASFYTKVAEPHVDHTLTADGQWHIDVVDLSNGGANTNWTGEFNRLDPLNSDSGSADYAWIALFADEAKAAAYTGPTVEYVKVNSYNDPGTVGVWVGKGAGHNPKVGVAFNAASSFNSFEFPRYWASNGSNAPLVTVDVNLYAFDTDFETSVAGTPLYTKTLNPTGDLNAATAFDLGNTCAAGEYVIAVEAVSDTGYFVLPNGASAYSSVRLAFTGPSSFAFSVNFVKADVKNYFDRLSACEGQTEKFEGNLCPQGSEPVDVIGKDLGIRVTVPADYKLNSITGLASPTWGNTGEGSNAEAKIYAWNTDYETTVAGDVLAMASVKNHIDNQNLVFNFDNGTNGDILIVISGTGEKSIGFWCGADKGVATAVYFNGQETNKCPGTNYAIELTGQIKVSLDRVYVDYDALSNTETDYAAQDTIVIKKGQTINILGWATNSVASLKRVYWTLDGEEKECSNTYRARGDLAAHTGFDAVYLGNSGYGLDSDMMELTGVSTLAKKTTANVQIIAEFTNGVKYVLKEFKLVVKGDVQQSVDAVAVNEDKYPVENNYNEANAITINEGDKINILGWVARYGTSVDKVFWQYIAAEGVSFDDEGVEIVTKECSDTYRDREAIAETIVVPKEYLGKSGFGFDDDLMELLGADELEPGVYTVRIRVLFEDGTEGVVKKKFTLTVNEAPKTELVGYNFDEVYANVTTIRVRGWARLNAAIGQFGYRIDDGEVVYNDAFQVDRSDVWNAFGVTKEVANGFDLILPASTVPAGKHTFTLLLKAADGTVFELGAMTVETPHEEEYTTIIDFDDADAYGMSIDGFWWNDGLIGAGRATADLFVRPDAMPVNDYGGTSTGFNGWVAFKQKVKGFGYIIDGKLFVSDAFTAANEDTLGPTVDAWEGWAGAGETVQRYNVQIPFAGQSGKINVMAAAILEDGTVVRLNSKAIHDRDTEINFIFNDVRDPYGSMAVLDTGWWTNPFNKDSVATITFTANGAFDGFETFIYASDVAQSIHMTLKDSDGNAVWEEDFNMFGNQRYTFYKRFGKFAPGDYTIEFDGRNMADDAGTWIVFGSTVPVEGEEKVAAASGSYGSNAGYTTLSFGLIKGTEYKEGSSRDQVTVDNVDKASYGGNPEVTDITENLHDLIGKQIRFWGWYGNNTELVKFGVKVDGGEMIYFDRYEDAGIVAHLQGVFEENAVSASRFEILVDITEGEHTAEVYAITDRGEVLVWTVNYNAVEEAVTQPTTEPETNQQTGDVALMVFASVVVLALGAAVVFKKKRVF